MNKNSKQIFGILLIGMFVLLSLQKVIGDDFRPWIIVDGPGGIKSYCIGDSLIPMTECDTTPYTIKRWRYGFWTKPSPTPGTTSCLAHTDTTCNRQYCCGTNACGSCIKYCTEAYSCRQCTKWPPLYPPDGVEECFKCVNFEPYPTVGPTIPCLPCLTQAAQPTNARQLTAAVGGSCECIELKPVEDKANHKLSFECLVAGDKDAQIKDYSVTFEKPGGNLITLNLKPGAITPTQCPSSAAPNSACYQVKTTSVDTTVKGTYKMIVPPQIVCE